MKHNVGKPVWVDTISSCSVWEEASEDIYIHTHTDTLVTLRPLFRVMDAFFVMTGYGMCHPLQHSTTGSCLVSLPCIVATELLVLCSVIF